MIHITFAPEQAQLAKRMRAELAGAGEADTALLIAIHSRQARGDQFVQAEIARALREGQAILPILVDDAALPEALTGRKSLDFRSGYDRAALLAHLSRRGQGDSLRKANRRALMLIGGLAALMFGLSLVAISSGFVAFPVDEYNEEATLQAEWIDGLVSETLQYAQPRSTQDAANFAATFAAAPTRLHFYIRGTATALAKEG